MVIPFQGTKSAIDSTPSTLSEAKRRKAKPRERQETNELVLCDTTDCRFDFSVSPDYEALYVQGRPSLLVSPGPFKSHRPSSLARLPVGLKFQQFGLNRRPQFGLHICPSRNELHHIMTSPQTSSNVWSRPTSAFIYPSCSRDLVDLCGQLCMHPLQRVWLLMVALVLYGHSQS
jgi:hypothetical protein